MTAPHGRRQQQIEREIAEAARALHLAFGKRYPLRDVVTITVGHSWVGAVFVDDSAGPLLRWRTIRGEL